MADIIPIRPPPPEMTEARAVALGMLAAKELQRRLDDLAKQYDMGAIASAVILSDSPADLELIGTMAGKAGHAIWRRLGIDEDGNGVPLPPSDESVEEARRELAKFYEGDVSPLPVLAQLARLLGVPR